MFFYDPVMKLLRVLYRSGRERSYPGISPVQLLALLAKLKLSIVLLFSVGRDFLLLV